MITLDELTDRLPLLTGAIFTIGLILFVLSLRMFRRSRAARYWFRRRQAGQRGFRTLVLSMLFLSLSLGLCIATLIFNTLEESSDTTTQQAADSIGETVTPSATVTASPTLTETIPISPTATFTATTMLEPTSTPTNTLLPTNTEIATEPVEAETLVPSIAVAEDEPTTTPTATDTISPSDTPTATEEPSNTPTLTLTNSPTTTNTPSSTPSLTLTPSETPTPTPITPTATPSNTPLPTLRFSAVNITPRATPDENAMIVFDVVAEGISNGEPENPTESFLSTTTRLYFFIDYQAMNTGVLWRWVLLRDDGIVTERALLWGPDGSGSTFFFIGQQAGFAIGEYELQLFIGDNDTPTDNITFSVTQP